MTIKMHLDIYNVLFTGQEPQHSVSGVKKSHIGRLKKLTEGRLKLGSLNKQAKYKAVSSKAGSGDLNRQSKQQK